MDPALLERLRTSDGDRLLRELTEALPAYSEAGALSVAQRFRAHEPADLLAAALTQVRLRARARTKFGEAAERLFFTAEGLEQATTGLIAGRRARRFADAGFTSVADLCCGLGADALALAAAGCSVLAVERDALPAALAAANAAALGLADRVRVRCADVTGLALPGDLEGSGAAFCDPARRDGRGRRLAPETWSPPFSWVRALAAAVPATGAKVAPGIPHDLVPAGVEAEWVSVAGEVKEAALWWGPLATGPGRRATLLPEGATLAEEGLGTPPVGAPRRYLYEPDGAVIRAGLVAEVAGLVAGTLLDPRIAYVTSAAHIATPYATAYEVTDVLPFSVKALRALLRQRGVGVLTVKKRGSAIEPEAFRRQMRLQGDAAATIVLTRLGGAPTALLVEPVGPGTPAHKPPA